VSNLPKIDEFFEAGAHFGHLREKWHPKMKPYIFSIRNNTHIFNLESTLESLEKAIDFIKAQIVDGKMVLFIGTKRQAREAIKEAAITLGMPYIDYRWLGGTLTNFETIQKNLKRFKEAQEKNKDKEFVSVMTKKEKKNFDLELEKMERNLGGIQDIERIPDALFIVDAIGEKVAVEEANQMNLPVIGIIDSDSNPDKFAYPIPANDDSKLTIKLILKTIVENCQDTKKNTKKEAKK